MITRVDALCPPITTMIRMDHTHVLMAFRRFRSDLSPARKHAIVNNVCIALQIHAQLEEEIFYPALEKVGIESEVLDKSVPEHDEMRALIQTLRSMSAEQAGYDEEFRALIRAVLHHVADEETTLLPQAEDRLRDDLGSLGWAMTRRRMQLLKPHALEVATTTAQTFPIVTALAAASMVALGWLMLRGTPPQNRALLPRR